LLEYYESKINISINSGKKIIILAYEHTHICEAPILFIMDNATQRLFRWTLESSFNVYQEYIKLLLH